MIDGNDLNLYKGTIIILTTNKTFINDDICNNGIYTNIFAIPIYAQINTNIYNHYHVY